MLYNHDAKTPGHAITTASQLQRDKGANREVFIGKTGE
jgi:hypothetical protein